jgi:hypothetical protein
VREKTIEERIVDILFDELIAADYGDGCVGIEGRNEAVKRIMREIVDIPTLDAAMKLYICDCSKAGMSISDITEKLHQEGDPWVKACDVKSVIDDMNHFKNGTGRWAKST